MTQDLRQALKDSIAMETEDGFLEICPVTRAYCTGEFCDDYGCAKLAGIWDDDPLESI